MRVLVCGSRDWTDDYPIHRMLTGLTTVDTVIHGGARGADTLAGHWAAALGIPVLEYPADWDTHGNSAGHIRNQHMLDDGRPDVVWAFRLEGSSPGTDNMILRSVDAGVPVYVVRRV